MNREENGLSWIVPVLAAAVLLVAAGCIWMIMGRLAGIARLEQQIALAEAERAELLERIQQWEDAIDQLRRDELALMKPESVKAVEFKSSLISQLEGWTDRVDRLAAFLTENPYLMTPEMITLEALDWYDVTRGKVLETEADYRKALAYLRGKAKAKVTPGITEALRAYQRDSGGAMPGAIADLLPYIEDPLARSVMERFRIEAPAPGDPEDTTRLLIYEGGMRDPLWDQTYLLRSNSTGTQYTFAPDRQMKEAISRFESDHGQSPRSVTELDPYLDEVRSVQNGAFASGELLEDLFTAVTTKP